MSDITEGQRPEEVHPAHNGQDSLARAAEAGPPLDWDDEDKTPENPSRTVAANRADPMHSIYGEPPAHEREGD